MTADLRVDRVSWASILPALVLSLCIPSFAYSDEVWELSDVRLTMHPTGTVRTSEVPAESAAFSALTGDAPQSVHWYNVWPDADHHHADHLHTGHHHGGQGTHADHRHADSVAAWADREARWLVSIDENGQTTWLDTSLRLTDGFLISRTDDVHAVVDVHIALESGQPQDAVVPALLLGGLKGGIDTDTSRFHFVAGEVLLSSTLADSLGMAPTGSTLGYLELHGIATWIGGDEPIRAPSFDGRPRDDGTLSLTQAGGAGPDMTFCQLFGLEQFGRTAGFVGMALATTSWNIGTEPLVWFANPDVRHPFIVSNVFRLENDRFEQIGQSWVKHGFCAVDNEQCSTSCQGTGCPTLGVGCTDTYSASLNATQSLLGPRSEVNPWTGDFVFEGSHLDSTHSHSPIDHRILMHDSDLNPADHPEATYFAEGYYVCPDDVDVSNNFAHKTVTFSGNPGGEWDIGMSGAAEAPLIGPAITSWPGATFTLIAQELPVQEFASPDGRCLLAAKATPLDDTWWHYEYALYNIDMDRKVGGFAIPLPDDAEVADVGFHYPFVFGEPYGNTEWAWERADGAIRWETEDNPCRWGTLYNFRFAANVPPSETTVTLGHFDPGIPESVTGTTVGPRAMSWPAPMFEGPAKNRYLSFRPGSIDGELSTVQALRLRAQAFPAFTRWVSPPDENGICRLSCDPVYADFGQKIIHIADEDVRPGITYELQGVPETSGPVSESDFSAPAVLLTADLPGDVVSLYRKGRGWLEPDGRVDFRDILAILHGYNGWRMAPDIERIDIAEGVPDLTITLADLEAAVMGFQSAGISGGGLSNCKP